MTDEPDFIITLVPPGLEGVEPDPVWGFIPYFLHEDDPRPAKEQFNERYISGWDPFKGFIRNDKGELCYPDDPPLKPIAMARFRNERIFMYPCAWVLIMQQDGSWEVCRMD